MTDLQNRPSSRGWTPLHLAAYLGSPNAVTRLFLYEIIWSSVKFHPLSMDATCKFLVYALSNVLSSALTGTRTEGVLDRNGRSVDDLKRAARTGEWNHGIWKGTPLCCLIDIGNKWNDEKPSISSPMRQEYKNLFTNVFDKWNWC